MTILLSPPPTPTMSTGPRGRRRIGIIVIGTVVALVATAVAAAITFETLAATLDRRAYPAPGALVDVGGHKLHLVCTGQGSPTVILETGYAATSSAWALVQPAVAASTRTCAYDRAGLGWSEPGPEPRDARRIATELHTLLQSGEIAGPYVLVGHSNGGLYARMFASLYSSDVAGVVLVEATPSDLLTRLPEVRTDLAEMPRQAQSAELLAHVGLARMLIAPKARAELDAFPPFAAEAFVANQATAGFWRTLGAEARSLETSLDQVQHTGDLGARPLVVMWTPEGAPSPEAAAIKREMEAEMAALSTNSAQIVVEGASHMGFATRPEHAAITSRAVLRVVNAIRAGKTLDPEVRP